MFSYLQKIASLATSDANFPYILSSQPCTSNISSNDFIQYDGNNGRTNELVTVLVSNSIYDVNDTNSRINNYLTKLKTTRHPHILKYIDSSVVNNKLYIVTERVMELSLWLDTFKQSDVQVYHNSVCLGIYHIASAISFINNTLKSVHGNITHTSIYVSQTGDFKLAGLQHCCEYTKLNKNTLYSMRNTLSQYASPELMNQSDTLLQAPINCIDSWSFGCLLYALYNGVYSFTSSTQLTTPGKIPNAILSDYKKLLATNMNNRFNTQQLLDTSKLFKQNQFLQVILFLENLPIKSSDDKIDFFTNKFTPDSIQQYPITALQHKILPTLTTSLDFGSGLSVFNNILTCILKIGQLLGTDIDDKQQYEKLVLPTITNLYSKQERSIRVQLLSTLNMYIDYLNNDLINNTLFNSIITGFTDSTPLLRELTVKSIPLLASKLNNSNFEQLLQRLNKLQIDVEPAIRTNTIYCIAKISSYLTTKLRDKLLLPSFVRGLKDTFIPARLASINSMAATIEYYDCNKLAKQVLPNISVCTVDTNKDVRDAALKLINVIVGKLSDNSDQLPNIQQSDITTPQSGTTLSQPTATTVNTSNSMTSTFGNLAAGYLGSAVSNVTNSLVNEVTNRMVSPTKPAKPIHPVSNIGTDVGSKANKPIVSQSTVSNNNGFNDTAAATKVAPTSAAVNSSNGWNDDLDDDFGDDNAAEINVNTFDDWSNDGSITTGNSNSNDILKLSTKKTPPSNTTQSNTVNNLNDVFNNLSTKSATTSSLKAPIIKPTGSKPKKSIISSVPIIKSNKGSKQDDDWGDFLND